MCCPDRVRRSCCATVLALAACGGDDGSGGAEREPGVGRDARGGGRRDARRPARGARQLPPGDRAAAEDQVAEAYVSHFEEVEGPLEKVDHELKEELEEAIGDELRRRSGRRRRRPRSSSWSARSTPTSTKAEAELR